MANRIKIANETIQIIRDGGYDFDGKHVEFVKKDYYDVEVYRPKRLEDMVQEAGEKISENADLYSDGMQQKNEQSDRIQYGQGENGTNTRNKTINDVISVIDSDSFEAAKDYHENILVMNFANAQVPGGGFRMGATAQEELLCRNSTLYASIKLDKASEMYRYNMSHPSAIPSVYMLLSPNVYVFRDSKCRLLEQPFKVSVITLPAPNRNGLAVFTGREKIANVMKERIRMMLAVAMEHGYETLILGAWGCGAFGHTAENVAGYFKEVLLDEGYVKVFKNIVFAIYHGDRDGKCDVFRNILRK